MINAIVKVFCHTCLISLHLDRLNKINLCHIHNPFLAWNFSAEGPRLFFLKETPLLHSNLADLKTVRALPRVCKALEKYILLGSCLCKPFESLKICKSAPF